MRKSILFIMVLCFCITSCQNESVQMSHTSTSKYRKESSILIVYFSSIGNMELPDNVDVSSTASINEIGDGYIGDCGILADKVADMTSGRVFQIRTKKTYSSNYDTLVKEVLKEQQARSEPALTSQVDHIEQYKTIYLIYPIWKGDLPQAVVTFLKSYDFSHKSISPIATSEGSGMSNTVERIRSLVSADTIIKNALPLKGNEVNKSQKAIQEWINLNNNKTKK